MNFLRTGVSLLGLLTLGLLMTGCTAVSDGGRAVTNADWRAKMEPGRRCAELQTQSAALLAQVIANSHPACSPIMETALRVVDMRYAELERCELSQIQGTESFGQQSMKWQLVADRLGGERLTLADESLKRGCRRVAEAIFRHVLRHTLPLLRRQQGLEPRIDAYIEHARTGLVVARTHKSRR